MLENRIKGAQLAKRVSYIYLICAIILIIAGFALEGYDKLIFGGIFYAVMFVIIYFISTKFGKSKHGWILLAACAIITVIVTHGMLSIAFAILLLVCANDMRKELDN